MGPVQFQVLYFKDFWTLEDLFLVVLLHLTKKCPYKKLLRIMESSLSLLQGFQKNFFFMVESWEQHYRCHSYVTVSLSHNTTVQLSKASELRCPFFPPENSYLPHVLTTLTVLTLQYQWASCRKHIIICKFDKLSGSDHGYNNLFIGNAIGNVNALLQDLNNHLKRDNVFYCQLSNCVSI